MASYENGVPVVSVRQEVGYTAVYPTCTRCGPDGRVRKGHFVAKKAKRCTRRVPESQIGYTVSLQQPAGVPVYPPYRVGTR